MARIKLSEFRAKSLLVPGYDGHALTLDTLDADVASLIEGVSYVVKVDQGVKKRGKQGLVRLGVTKETAAQTVRELSEKGFTRFIAEPMISHEDADEKYVSFERTADGIVMSYSEHGGVDIEEHSESIIRSINNADIPLPVQFLDTTKATMDSEHMSFVEINPLVVQGSTCVLLDAAVLVDSAGEQYARWTSNDTVEARTKTEVETAIAELNENSTAALSFRVLNPDGALWLLLSGGGASITIADEAHNAGKAELIGNYGEYSGGPTTEETYLYAKQVLKQMLRSTAPKKALIIAGGVANFTDVKKTFAGIIQALKELQDECKNQGVKVFVRRGGPNEVEGLASMKKYLTDNDLFGSVHGSDVILTDVIHEALEYVNA
jgi:ATP-citrate lyase beta-subunit